jgi:hypothetical protein
VPLTEDLQDYQEKSAGRKGGSLEKFNLTATQAILYFDSIAPGATITLHFRLGQVSNSGSNVPVAGL